jgi:hypothetical protein
LGNTRLFHLLTQSLAVAQLKPSDLYRPRCKIWLLCRKDCTLILQPRWILGLITLILFQLQIDSSRELQSIWTCIFSVVYFLSKDLKQFLSFLNYDGSILSMYSRMWGYDTEAFQCFPILLEPKKMKCHQIRRESQRPFGGIKHSINSCIPSFNCYNLKIQKATHAHFFPLK